jgi:hypothetical protein
LLALATFSSRANTSFNWFQCNLGQFQGLSMHVLIFFLGSHAYLLKQWPLGPSHACMQWVVEVLKLLIQGIFDCLHFFNRLPTYCRI